MHKSTTRRMFRLLGNFKKIALSAPDFLLAKRRFLQNVQVFELTTQKTTLIFVAKGEKCRGTQVFAKRQRKHQTRTANSHKFTKRKHFSDCHLEFFRKRLKLVVFQSHIVHGELVEIGDILVYYKLRSGKRRALQHSFYLRNVPVVDVSVGNYMHEFPNLQAGNLRKHVHKHGVLHHICWQQPCRWNVG